MEQLDISKYAGKVNNVDVLNADDWNAVIAAIQSKVNECVKATNVLQSSPIQSSFYVDGTLTNPIDGMITLTAGTTHVLEGTLYGQIVIDAESSQPSDNTYLKLNGVTIITPATSGILYKTPTENKGYKDLVVTLMRDTINTIICTTVAAKADDQPACIYSMNNLVLQGVGYLSCINKGGHGIRGTEVRISSPRVYVEAVHDAFHAGKAMWIDDGYFFVNKANDAFGTGTDGVIKYYGGKIWAYGVQENVMDSKQPGYYVSAPDIVATNVAAAQRVSNMTPFSGKYAAGSVKCYSDNAFSKDEEVITAADGKYTITKPYVVITGKVEGSIVIPSIVGTTLSDGTTDHDVEIQLNDAYITSSTANVPAIQYTAGDGKVKIKVNKDTDSFVLQTATASSTGDEDAIKSENNISIEVKSGAHLVVKSDTQDGIDGGEIKITDTSGSLIVYGCGGRGIKGNAIVIGPSATITKSHIEKYVTDTTSDDYTVMAGAVIVKDNVKSFTVSEGKANDATVGYADIYARNGSKFSKGEFGTTDSELTGVLVTGSMAAVVTLDFGKATNVYYDNIVAGTVNNDCGKTYGDYVVCPWGKAPIVKK